MLAFKEEVFLRERLSEEHFLFSVHPVTAMLNILSRHKKEGKKQKTRSNF